MKTKRFLAITFLALILGSPIALAQNFKPFNSDECHNEGKNFAHRGFNAEHRMNLSDEQKTLLKEMHESHVKDMNENAAQLLVLKVKQKTLIESSSPDIKSIEENIDEISQKEASIAKMKLVHYAEMKKQFPELKMHNNRMHLQNGKHYGKAEIMKGNAKRGGKSNVGQGYQSKGGERMASHLPAQKKGVMHKKKAIKKNRGFEKGRHSLKGQTALSVESKEMVKKSMISVSADTRDLKNKLRVLHAEKAALLIGENVNIKAVNKNIDSAAKLKSEIMKISASAKVELLQKLSTEEREMLLRQAPHSKRKRL